MEPGREAQDVEWARRSTREPPVPSSSRTLAARIQAVPAASNRQAVRLTVIAHPLLASTAQGFPKRLMVQVQGHLAPVERACQRLPHASRHAEANDHSTRTTGIGPGARLVRTVVAFLFPLDRWQPQQRYHRTSYSTTCANTKRFLPPPAPKKESPFIPVLKRTGLSGPFSVNRIHAKFHLISQSTYPFTSQTSGK
ncbi:MAG: hypothetical protein ACXVCM_21195 [Ktedonobacteraceae bacterium]